jgi:hypothetical protein
MMFKGDHREIGCEHDSWVEIPRAKSNNEIGYNGPGLVKQEISVNTVN